MRISDGSSDVCSSDLEMLLRRHHGTESEIAGRGAAVEFRARHVALLDAQGAERLEAIRNDAEGLAGLEKACPNRFAVSSDERRVGNACVSTFRSRGWPYH